MAVEFRTLLSAGLDVQTLPAIERVDRLADYVREVLVRVLRLDAALVPPRDGRLMDLGIDSLMAVEFRTLLSAGLDVQTLPATLIFDHPTIDAIAAFIDRTAFGDSSDAAPTPAVTSTTGTTPAATLSVDTIEAMSDDDVEALLNQRLERM
jgi:acyl carrier protein